MPGRNFTVDILTDSARTSFLFITGWVHFSVVLKKPSPSLSAINAENQQITKQTPSFTPKNVKLGVFVFFKMKRIFAQKKCLNKTKPTKRTIKSCSFRWLLYQFNCLTAAMYQSNMCFGMDTALKTPLIR